MPNTVWIAVATHPNSEGRAVQNLKRQGYECYCPCAAVPRRRPGGGMGTRPFFPGYLFVRLDRTKDQWRPIMYSRGVRSVVRFGEHVGVVPAGVVESLIATEESGGLKSPLATERVSVGQRITLRGTLFDDFVATVQSIDARDRICVLLELMQRTVRLVVSSDQVAVT